MKLNINSIDFESNQENIGFTKKERRHLNMTRKHKQYTENELRNKSYN